ncbi:MAG: UDP-4-amino-4,6-dideoxy-N-acetyl-beta-L-altrosamine N-acetyltransferase [bacterium]|nr:UDP-4-amino-4,6-dideoxy-N-acetyl-beta-L-altrosamine N-acetyltransferase [bacterium]
MIIDFNTLKEKIKDTDPVSTLKTFDLKYNNYIIKNFTNINDREKRLVLKWRNHDSIRCHMINQNILTAEEHFSYISTLIDKSEVLYWLIVDTDNEYSGVIDLTEVDTALKKACTGIYISPEIKKTNVNLGSELYSILKKIAFEILNIELLKAEIIRENKAAVFFNIANGFKYNEKYHEKEDRGKKKDRTILFMSSNEYLAGKKEVK